MLIVQNNFGRGYKSKVMALEKIQLETILSMITYTLTVIAYTPLVIANTFVPSNKKARRQSLWKVMIH